jgi:hypothetical protein
VTEQPAWQKPLIDQLTALLRGDPDVVGLCLAGSWAQEGAAPDAWSDLDFVVVVTDHALPRLSSGADWLASLGDVYCRALSDDGWLNSVRCYYRDGRRVDCTIVRESLLDRVGEWPYNPFAYGARKLFSRSPLLDGVMERRFRRPEAPGAFEEQARSISDRFWFDGMLAAQKVARGDLLVAFHLALDLIRDCCVLAMMLRDKHTGTNHHRFGGEISEYVAKLQATQHPCSADGILASLEDSARLFDEFAGRLVSGYSKRRQPLLDYIRRVRNHLHGHSRDGASSA